MWFDAPASSPGPHFDGHHFSAVSLGGDAGWAWAAAIGARPNLPCVAPATAPAAPAIPAVFRKFRRSGEGGAPSEDRSSLSFMTLPPDFRFIGHEYPIDN